VGVHTTIGALGFYWEFLKSMGTLAMVKILILNGAKMLGSCLEMAN
jgi:hypothetical protein